MNSLNQLDPDTPSTLNIFRKLYPSLTDVELAKADVNLTRYVDLVLRIFERVNRERIEAGRLTGFDGTLRSDLDPSRPA